MSTVALNPGDVVWCEVQEKYLRVVSLEEADRICRDIQLYFYLPGSNFGWEKDSLPSLYRSEHATFPSNFESVYLNAIEVDVEKEEYAENG
jgi:hypothetical protein